MKSRVAVMPYSSMPSAGFMKNCFTDMHTAAPTQTQAK